MASGGGMLAAAPQARPAISGNSRAAFICNSTKGSVSLVNGGLPMLPPQTIRLVLLPQ
jgi:hypothetical protein